MDKVAWKATVHGVKKNKFWVQILKFLLCKELAPVGDLWVYPADPGIGEFFLFSQFSLFSLDT